MHGQLFLNGPVFAFLAGVVVLAAGLGVFVIGDSLRTRRRDALARVPEPAWLYAVFEAAYLVTLAAGQFPAAPDALRTASVALVIPALVAGVAYLLRVVYPRPSVAPEPARPE